MQRSASVAQSHARSRWRGRLRAHAWAGRRGGYVRMLLCSLSPSCVVFRLIVSGARPPSSARCLTCARTRDPHRSSCHPHAVPRQSARGRRRPPSQGRVHGALWELPLMGHLQASRQSILCSMLPHCVAHEHENRGNAGETTKMWCSGYLTMCACPIGGICEAGGVAQHTVASERLAMSRGRVAEKGARDPQGDKESVPRRSGLQRARVCHVLPAASSLSSSPSSSISSSVVRAVLFRTRPSTCNVLPSGIRVSFSITSIAMSFSVLLLRACAMHHR